MKLIRKFIRFLILPIVREEINEAIEKRSQENAAALQQTIDFLSKTGL